jgi:hypothetical protein
MLRYLKYILLIVLCSSLGCKKHHSSNPIDNLPTETQTGAGTFGCLLNGKEFTPYGSAFAGPILQCYYMNNTGSPGSFFDLGAKDKRDFNDWAAVGIGLDSIEITGPGIIPLTKAWTNGKGYGLIDHVLRDTLTQYITTDKVTGELNIKKFDVVKRIVAGTFWFKAISDKGDTFKITNGLFDMIFN